MHSQTIDYKMIVSDFADEVKHESHSFNHKPMATPSFYLTLKIKQLLRKHLSSH